MMQPSHKVSCIALKVILDREAQLSDFPNDEYRRGYLDALEYAHTIINDPLMYLGVDDEAEAVDEYGHMLDTPTHIIRTNGTK